MGTRFRIVVLLAAAALSGCGGGGGTATAPDYNWDSTPDADSAGPAIKVSYFRFEPSAEVGGQKTGRWVHSYKYTLSRGWMIKRGESPREPFERYWGRAAYMGHNIHDARMLEVVKTLEAAGLRELRETPLGSINMEALRRIEQVNDAEAAQKTRIITVETETYKCTVAAFDNSDPASLKKFRDVERQVIIWVFANTVLVSKESQSTMPRERR